uniref:Uncharacterized protein n=1 Tax=Steinernema glaseri TaxID=37863 RepID=A0A1I7YEU1_9BILA
MLWCTRVLETEHLSSNDQICQLVSYFCQQPAGTPQERDKEQQQHNNNTVTSRKKDLWNLQVKDGPNGGTQKGTVRHLVNVFANTV